MPGRRRRRALWVTTLASASLVGAGCDHGAIPVPGTTHQPHPAPSSSDPSSLTDTSTHVPPADVERLTAEPASLCLEPGEIGLFTIANNGTQDETFTSLNAWIFGSDRDVMFAARLNPGNPSTSDPLEFTTSTTMLPIGPSHISVGETAQLAVRAPEAAGRYELAVSASAPISIALTVEAGCPID